MKPGRFSLQNIMSRAPRLVDHQLQMLWLEHGEHAVKLVAAPQNAPVRRDYAPGALPARIGGAFLDLIERRFAGAPIDGEQRTIGQGVERVVAPLARSDLKPV